LNIDWCYKLDGQLLFSVHHDFAILLVFSYNYSVKIKLN